MKTTPALTVFLCSALAFSTSACTRGETHREPDPLSAPVEAASSGINGVSAHDRGDSSKVAVVTTTKGLLLPVERLAPDLHEESILNSAIKRELASCVARYGLTYSVAAVDEPQVGLPTELERAYGVADLSTAQRYGYHLPSSVDRVTPKGSAPEPSGELAVVMFGPQDGETSSSVNGKKVPAEGCSASSYNTIFRDSAASSSVLDEILIDAGNKARSDPSVERAIGRWADCMTHSGYRVPDPLAAASNGLSKTVSPTRPEIAMAVADMRCKISTNLLGIWYAADERMEEGEIADRQAEVSRYQAAWHAALTAAKARLARP